VWCATTLGINHPVSDVAFRNLHDGIGFMLRGGGLRTHRVRVSFGLVGIFAVASCQSAAWQDIFLSRNSCPVRTLSHRRLGALAQVVHLRRERPRSAGIPQLTEWKVIYGSFFTIPQGQDFLHFPPHYMHSCCSRPTTAGLSGRPSRRLGALGLLYGARKATAFYGPCLLVIFLEVAVMGRDAYQLAITANPSGSAR